MIFSLVKRTLVRFSEKQRKKENVVIMFGVPGVGKGTYGKLLAKDFNFLQLSPGDIIRKNI